MNLSPDLRPVVVSSSAGTVISPRWGTVSLYMCPSVPPLARQRFACWSIQSGRFGASFASAIVPSHQSCREERTIGRRIGQIQIQAQGDFVLWGGDAVVVFRWISDIGLQRRTKSAEVGF